MGVRNSRYWMGQLNWFIDDAGNRENSGADSAHPIPENERLLRMGPNARWDGGEYHLHYLTDLDNIELLGQMTSDSAVFLHGSATNGQGQSTLLSGTAGTVVAQNYGTNTPWQVPASAIPVSWTTSGYITASSTSRMRLTSGATVGGKLWLMKDLGAKTARCSNIYPALTYTLASIGIPVIGREPGSLTTGDTFLIEKLTQVKNFKCNLQSDAIFTTVSPANNLLPQPNIIIESLCLGRRDSNYGLVHLAGQRATYLLDGCLISGVQDSSFDNCMVYVCGCAHANSTGNHKSFNNGYYHCGFSLGQLLVDDAGDFSSIAFFRDWIIQNNGTVGRMLVHNRGRVQPFRFACFDCTTAIQLQNGSEMTFFKTVSGNCALWGSGNTTGYVMSPFTRVSYPTGQGAGFTMANASSDITFEFGGKTTSRVFDDGIGLYTTPRTMSFANLQASIASGGFGERISDPVGLNYFGITGSTSD